MSNNGFDAIYLTKNHNRDGGLTSVFESKILIDPLLFDETINTWSFDYWSSKLNIGVLTQDNHVVSNADECIASKHHNGVEWEGKDEPGHTHGWVGIE